MAPQGSNRKHSHGKHAAHESPTPAAQTPETKGGAPAAKSPASSTPKVLSSKVTSMKFMQRSAKNEKAKDPAAGAAHREAAANADKEDFQGPPKLVLVDGGRHPLLHFVAGRRSFGGMNVAMETWAAQQDKSYRRALRDATRGGPAAHVPREVDVNAILSAKNEGKDLTDKQMAAVLGKKRGAPEEGVEAEEGGGVDEQGSGGAEPSLANKMRKPRAGGR